MKKTLDYVSDYQLKSACKDAICIAPCKVTQMIFAVLEDWCHHIVLEHSYKQHLMAHFRKLRYRCKKSRRYLLRKPSYSQFCPKFRCHGTGGRSREMRLAAFNGRLPKTLLKVTKIAKIFYTSWVIANFVPNFVAITKGVDQRKVRLAAFDGATPTTLSCK